MKTTMGGEYTVWTPEEVTAMGDSSLRAEVALWRDVHAIGNQREKRHAAMQIRVCLPELRRRGLE